MNPGCSARIPDETLHRLFDGDLTDAELTRHVEACDACTARLNRLREQHKLLATLFGGGGEEELGARLGDLLQHHAKESLADLVFELAEACLVRARRKRLLPEPRPPEDLLPEIASVGARLDGLGEGVDLTELKAHAETGEAPEDGDLSTLIAACVRILAVLEGDSSRVETLEAETR